MSILPLFVYICACICACLREFTVHILKDANQCAPEQYLSVYGFWAPRRAAKQDTGNQYLIHMTFMNMSETRVGEDLKFVEDRITDTHNYKRI